MRKFLLVLMALCLAVLPCLAEGAAPSESAAPVETIDYDFGDFTLNVVWTEDVTDLSAIDPAAFAQTVVDSVIPVLAQQGITATNPTILAATMDEVGGKPAFSVIYSADLDYSGAGVDLQANITYIQAFVSEEGLGSYTFTISTDNLDGCQSLIDIVNTTVWAK